eukprot:symbB.v1.2.036870.t1/scaffold5310.1/size28534/2
MIKGDLSSLLASLKEVKLPPLVHPETLLAAAKRCADFGGSKELLDSAALAGILLQAHVLRAHRDLAEAGIAPPGVDEPSPPPPETGPPEPPTPVEEAELSLQAKQAMAAAAATNLQARKQAPPETPSVPSTLPNPPALPAINQIASNPLAAVLKMQVPQAMVAHPMVLPVHHLAFNGARKIGSFKKIPVDVGGYFDFI